MTQSVDADTGGAPEPAGGSNRPDAGTGYSNADLRKGEEAEEIFRFIEFWKRQHGELPRHLVFDSRLTTYAHLARLDQMGITFMTLRRRTAALLQEVADLPASAWRR